MVTILQSPFVIEFILPFLLVFAVVFAVLQKSRILGEGKKQVDLVVALVVGLIVIAFGQATGLIIQLSAFLGVALVVILVFLIIMGGITGSGDMSDLFGEKFKMVVGILALISVVIAVIIFSGFWDYVYEFFALEGDGNLIMNLVIIVVVVGAVVAVAWPAKSGDSGS